MRQCGGVGISGLVLPLLLLLQLSSPCASVGDVLGRGDHDMEALEVDSAATIRRELKGGTRKHDAGSSGLRSATADDDDRLKSSGQLGLPPLRSSDLTKPYEGKVNLSDPFFKGIIAHYLRQAQERRNRTAIEQMIWRQIMENVTAEAQAEGQRYIPEAGYTFGYGPPGPSEYGPDEEPDGTRRGFQNPAFHGQNQVVTDAEKSVDNIGNIVDALVNSQQETDNNASEAIEPK